MNPSPATCRGSFCLHTVLHTIIRIETQQNCTICTNLKKKKSLKTVDFQGFLQRLKKDSNLQPFG